MHLRPATRDDAGVLLTWRNDPVVRNASRSTEVVALAEHTSWLTHMLESERAWLFIGVDGDDEPVGHTRIVEENGSAEVSIVVAPQYRGRGLGRELLALTHDAYIAHGGHLEVRAFVKEENRASQRLFLAAGYVADEVTDMGTWYTWSGRE